MKMKIEQKEQTIPTGLDLYVLIGLDNYTIKDIMTFKDWKRAYRIMLESTILYYKTRELNSEKEVKEDAKSMFKATDIKLVSDWINEKFKKMKS